jgi:hypothetical protein
MRTSSILTTEEVLMICVLFTWFENVQCNFDTAVTHLQSGVKILADWRAEKQPSPAGSGSAVIEDLAYILDRLTFYGMPHHKKALRAVHHCPKGLLIYTKPISTSTDSSTGHARNWRATGNSRRESRRNCKLQWWPRLWLSSTNGSDSLLASHYEYRTPDVPSTSQMNSAISKFNIRRQWSCSDVSHLPPKLSLTANCSI